MSNQWIALHIHSVKFVEQIDFHTKEAGKNGTESRIACACVGVIDVNYMIL